mgnify:CR=1 FL=1
MRKAADFEIQGRAQWLMSGAILNPEISKSAKLKLSEFAELNVGRRVLALDKQNHVCYTLCQNQRYSTAILCFAEYSDLRRSPE